jgi:diacylglycerol kinase family enzyme
LLVVVGGDGTMNDVVTAPRRRTPSLPSFPNGNRPGLGRTHGDSDRLRDAVRVALSAASRGTVDSRVTLGNETRYFAYVGSAGMSGSVAHRANSMSKALGGRATFSTRSRGSSSLARTPR